MSCNAWEAGTIKLPTAEAKKVRDTLKKAVEDRRTLLYNKAQEFWKSLPAKTKTNRSAYMEAAEKFAFDAGRSYRTYREAELASDLGDELYDLLVNKGWPYAGTKAQRIKQTDLAKLYGPCTGANPTFWIGDGSISFRGREVSYDVADSHGCDRPREHPISRMLWSALSKVNWTRGSGGEILGNNEYNEEAGRGQAGGGGSYVVMSFGPKSKNTRHQWGAGEVYYR
jgi:hypothetical protein